MNSPLIRADVLRERLASDPHLVVLDASFDLADTQAGERAHAAGHVPGALYLHLDRDLSAPKTGLNGRHPLPAREAFAARLGELGIDETCRIVACDGNAGMYAARLWWMLRWLGHADVLMLDGGLAAWRAAGGALESGPVAARPPARMPLRPPLVQSASYAELLAGLGRADAPLVVDARAADRFRGENETLDPVGGRIPGAVNRFFRDNLAVDGCFKPAEQLRAEWLAATGGRAATEQVHQCGSGVTACHNLVALEVAGLGGARLYPGSWSEWCAQPGAPVARG
ncbi:MAG: sulfurtransferase [Ideonella sp.]|nr:sulfurtransferase [Ideonella sp.]